MADPLSITAGAAGFISLGLSTAQGLLDYYNAYKRQGTSVERLCNNLDRLIPGLSALDQALNSRRASNPADDDLVQAVQAAKDDCEILVLGLQEELEKIKPPPEQTATFKGKLKLKYNRVMYPFKKGTLINLNDDIEAMLQNISTSLGVLQFQDTQRLNTDISEVKAALNLVRQTQLSEKLRQWLRPSDPSIEHEKACERRHAHTGLWLLEGSRFQSWLGIVAESCDEPPQPAETESNSLHDLVDGENASDSWLWIVGSPGSGKSILCSTAIQQTMHFKLSRRSSSVGVAYFYFTFTDDKKQDVDAMLVSWTLQLSHQMHNGSTVLQQLYESHSLSRPSRRSLLETLHIMVEQFDDVFFILDAIDESPLELHRQEVLGALQEIYTWHNNGVHLLATSRDCRDIRETLNPICRVVHMANKGVDHDITSYVAHCVENHHGLQKWRRNQQYAALIKEALTKGAKGVFRWVECQLESLRQCPVNRQKLQQHLQSLPPTLDKTYEQMLLRTPRACREEARRLLLFLCFARRPVFEKEVIHYLAITRKYRFDESRLFQSVEDLLEICPSFLYITEDYYNYHPTKRIQLAHYSVQEYLVSDRIRHNSEIEDFYLDANLAHADISESCVGYMLSEGVLAEELSESELRREYDFLSYATENWDFHYQQVDEQPASLQLVLSIFELLTSGFNRTRKWCSIRSASSGDFIRQQLPKSSESMSVLLLASCFDLSSVARYVIEQGKKQNATATDPELLNESEMAAFRISTRRELKRVVGNLPFTAIHSAIARGHHRVLNIFLDEGMDVNTLGEALPVSIPGGLLQPRPPITPLNVALGSGRVDIVQLLVSKGANVALAIEHEEAVRASIYDYYGEGPGDMSFQLLCSEKALHPLLLEPAIRNMEADTVENILEADQGSDLTLFEIPGYCPVCTALGVYSRLTGSPRSRDYSETSDLEVHISQAFCERDQLVRIDRIILVLLRTWPRFHGENKSCQLCLSQAVAIGRIDYVQSLTTSVLSDQGVVRGPHLCSLAVADALEQGFPDIMSVLLRNGAQPGFSIRKFLWRTGRDARRYESIRHQWGKCVQTLLTADTSTRTISLGQQLALAAFAGDCNALENTLSIAPKIDEGAMELALAWSATLCHLHIVRRLLDRIEREPSWALSDAVASEDLTVLGAFLNRGIDWEKEGGHALVSAIRLESLEVVELLLEGGADSTGRVSNQVERQSQGQDVLQRQLQGTPSQESPLVEACLVGHLDMVRLLIANGALTHPPGYPEFISAVRGGNIEIVQLLINAGADVKALDAQYPFGDSPMTTAIEYGNLEIVQLLLTVGIDMNAVDDGGISLLGQAACSGYPKIFDLLRTAGAELNEYSDLEHTLGAAVATYSSDHDGQLNVIKYLLSKGAKITETALERTRGNRMLLKLLHEHKPKNSSNNANFND